MGTCCNLSLGHFVLDCALIISKASNDQIMSATAACDAVLVRVLANLLPKTSPGLSRSVCESDNPSSGIRYLIV